MMISDLNTQVRVLDALATNFYQIVPQEFQTYCALTSTIAREVLIALGVDACLLPCQLWCATPDNNYVVGFTNSPDGIPRWDGHVICQTKNFVMDTAVRNLNRDFGLDTPAVVVSKQFKPLQTQVISRRDLSSNMSLWWHQPPQGILPMPPKEPQEIVRNYAGLLIERLQRVVSASTIAG